MRLPRTVIPRSYNVELWLDLDTCEFQGLVTANLEVTRQATSLIVLNTADLVIQTVSATSGPSKVVSNPISVDEDKDNELLQLQFENAFEAGLVVLQIKYHGRLNEKLDGFYKSSYEVDGIKKNMAATTFEPADARRCFPCWDEPDFKAAFVFKVHAPSDRLVLSNMPVAEQTLQGSTQTVTFQESVLMSTYLTALVVGEFENMEATTEDGIVVRAYTPHGQLSKAKFAFDIAVKLLPFFTDFFQVPYPLPKLDLVSVAEFKAGAIENFGSILFRNEAMLVDDNSTATQRQEIAINVAHEVAHMWFGNTVTMEWWTHLWLNEGMATWISYFAVDYLFPDWEIWMDFNDVRVQGFTLDGLQKTHPVELEVGHVRETDSAFDAISYFKGASLMLMLHSYLGSEDLKKGVRKYVQRFAFGNAASSDLWDSLEQATGKSVTGVMHSWTKQDGYPVVQATLLENGDLQLNQARFLANGQEAEGKWMIPVVISSAVENSRVLTKVMLVEKQSTFSLPSSSGSASWIKVNAGEEGFFRVQYTKKMLEMLKAAVGSGDLETLDRLGLLEDMYELCRSGRETLHEVLNMLEAYKNERHPTVLSAIIKVVVAIAKALQYGNPEVFDDAKLRLSAFIEAPARNIGWEATANESHLTAVVRTSLLDALVMLQHNETCKEAKARFEARSERPIPSASRLAIFRNAVQNTSLEDRANFDALVDIYNNSSDVEERMDLLAVLAGSKDPSLVREALNLSLTSKVLQQDVSALFRGVSQVSFPTAWTWLKENWDAIYEKVGRGFILDRIVRIIAGKVSEHKHAEEFKEFMTSRCVGGRLEKIMLESWEDACLRVEWTKIVINHFS